MPAVKESGQSSWQSWPVYRVRDSIRTIFFSSPVIHISQDKGFASSSKSLAMLECPVFGTWGPLGSLPWSLGLRKPQDAFFKKDHMEDEGLVSSPAN